MRTLNTFIRRLDSSEDAVLRGQIQLLLSKIFPLTDKSGSLEEIVCFYKFLGLNMKGNFSNDYEIHIETMSEIK